MARYMVACLMLCGCMACEGGIPFSEVDGPLAPTVSKSIPADIFLPEGSLSAHDDGPNLAISGDNLKDAVEGLFPVLMSVMNQATMVDSVRGTLSPGIRTIDGDGSVLSGYFAAEVKGKSSYIFTANYTVELRDWNYGGDQYFGGGLALEMTYRDILNAYDAFEIEAMVDGRLNFCGEYMGFISFRDLYVKWGAWHNEYKGNIRINVDGELKTYYLEKTCYSPDCMSLTPVE